MECDCPICREGIKNCPNCGSDKLVKGTYREKGKKYPKYTCGECKHRFIDVVISEDELRECS